jgi:ribosome-associated heat shock protein Hsp15
VTSKARGGPSDHDGPLVSQPEPVRLDVWLDVACLVATRSQAKELCDGGKVEVNGQRAKPHRVLRPGDRISLGLGHGHRREVVVKGLTDRHIAKAQARELYDDVTPPPTPEELEMRQLRRFAPPPAPPRGSGRPEKRDRRQIERLRRPGGNR